MKTKWNDPVFLLPWIVSKVEASPRLAGLDVKAEVIWLEIEFRYAVRLFSRATGMHMAFKVEDSLLFERSAELVGTLSRAIGMASQMLRRS